MVLTALGELELLQFGLPTDKAQQVFRVHEEIKEGLCLRQEYILYLRTYHCLEISIGGIGNGRAYRPNQSPSADNVQSLHVLLITIGVLRLLQKTLYQKDQALGYLQLYRGHGLNPRSLRLNQGSQGSKQICQ